MPLLLSYVCNFCLFQELPEGGDSRIKFLLTENTKMSIRPVEEIIIDESFHRERGSRV
jgi:hypothetical protein